MPTSVDPAITLPSAPSRAAGGPMPSAADIALLRAHPKFLSAVHAMMRGIIDVYDGNRILNQVMNDRGRAVFGTLALYLHFSSEEENSLGGFSAARMKQLCVETGLCSSGRATAMLLLMRYAGYLVPAPDTMNRRTRPLVPTERMIKSQRDRLTCQFRAMSLLMPEGALGLTQLHREDFLASMACQFGSAFRAGFRILDVSPALYPLAERNAGMIILFSLFMAGDSGSQTPKPFAVSISALSRRFTVSRPHVLKLLRDAQRLGFLAPAGAGDELFIIRPGLHDALTHFAATVFLFLAQCVRNSMDDLS